MKVLFSSLAALLLAAFLFYGWSLAAAGRWLEFAVLAISSLVTLAVYGHLEGTGQG